MADDFGIEEPQSDKARIVELVNMNLQQATNFGELAKRFDALKVELEEAKAHEIEAWDAKSAQDDENWKFIENLKSERDAALDQVVALRCLVDDFFNYVGGADDPRLDGYLMDRAVDALMDTSATAQQTVERIEREALEKFIAIITNPENEIVWRRPERGSIHADSRFIRDAILGEKGQG